MIVVTHITHSTDPEACDPGTYAPLGSSACTPCPPGFFCPTVTSGVVSECQPGTYSIGGAQQCTTCPAGYACPYTTQAVEELCISGTYAVGGQTNCSACPAGKSCDIYGTTILDCLPGYHSNTAVSKKLSALGRVPYCDRLDR